MPAYWLVAGCQHPEDMAKRRRTAATIPSDLQAALDHIHSGTSAH
jgi:hypothetical protein